MDRAIFRHFRRTFSRFSSMQQLPLVMCSYKYIHILLHFLIECKISKTLFGENLIWMKMEKLGVRFHEFSRLFHFLLACLLMLCIYLVS